MAKTGKSCFVIGPIGDPGSDIRKWSDTILDCIIEPAVTACGYDKPIRADHISQTGMITVQILEHLIGDDLVIADLTDSNPNVYYELAVRHAARKPFVQLIKDGQSIPFDLKDLRTIRVDRDVEIALRATQQLQKYIPEAEKQADKIVTPISMAASLKLMRDSGDIRQQELADVISKVDTLTSLIRGLPKDKYPSVAPCTIVEDRAGRGGAGGTVALPPPTQSFGRKIAIPILATETFGRRIAIPIAVGLVSAILLAVASYVHSPVSNWLSGAEIYWKPLLPREGLFHGDHTLVGYSLVNRSSSDVDGFVNFEFDIYKAADVRIEIGDRPLDSNSTLTAVAVEPNTGSWRTVGRLEKTIYISPGDSHTQIRLLNPRQVGMHRVQVRRSAPVARGESRDLVFILWTFPARFDTWAPEVTISGRPCMSEEQYLSGMRYRRLIASGFWLLYGALGTIFVSAALFVFVAYRELCYLRREREFESQAHEIRYP
jgi:hypothetical protein